MRISAPDIYRRTAVRCGAIGGLAFAMLLAGCAPAGPSASRMAPGGTRLYIGTHTGGAGQGIFEADFDERDGAITNVRSVAGIERPTWIVRDPQRPVLYSVSETGNDGRGHGSVYSFAINTETGALTQLSHVDSGGGGATYLDYSPRLSMLFVANFGGGEVAAIPVGREGSLASPSSIVTDRGSGPGPRQHGPHAHSVVVDPSARYVVVPDLGADRIFVYRINAQTGQLSPAATPFVQMPPGSGPRHITFSPDGRFAYLDTELTGEIYVFDWNAQNGTLSMRSHLAIDPPSFTGERSSAEIALSRDGRFLYVSNRGENTVQVYAVDRKTGSLTEIQRLPSEGAFPWSFAIAPSGRWLIVTNEQSSVLSVFDVDPRTGKLRASGRSASVPTPVALTYSPQ